MAANLRTGALVAFSALGILYSAYLSYVSLFTGRGGCEVFYFGLPSCFYGLVLYVLILVAGIATLLVYRNWRSVGIVAISMAGIGFSGYLTAYVLSLRSCVALLILGIPPCVLGLAMYALVLVLAISLPRH